MRKVINPQLELGSVPIEAIDINPQSRDDIPAVLKGIQFIYSSKDLRDRIFSLLKEELFRPQDGGQDAGEAKAVSGLDPNNGRPGMDLWAVLVLALVKQGLGCDFDRLAELASKHLDLRQMLGIGSMELKEFTSRTVARNVQLLTPELLRKVNREVVKAGQRLAGWQEGEELTARCDSFVVETNVDYPTDYWLLRNALVAALLAVVTACETAGVSGCRQHKHWKSKVELAYRQLRVAYKRKNKKKEVKRLLSAGAKLLKRLKKLRPQLEGSEVDEGQLGEIDRLLELAYRLKDQVRRRLLKGEQIPHAEKVFSIHAEHTRWISKGKAGQPVELGVPVVIVESKEGFVLGWKNLWKEVDVEVTVQVMEDMKKEWPDLEGCSFDKGFSSIANILALGGVLGKPALPKKGKLSKADKERESEKWFKEARREHSAVESAINNLEQRGLDRVLEQGKEGFRRVVARSILAANVHRMGLLLQRAARAAAKERRDLDRGGGRLRKAA